MVDRPVSKGKKGTPEEQPAAWVPIVVAIVGAVASIAVAWIAANASARPAAESALRDASADVDRLEGVLQDVDDVVPRFAVVAINAEECPAGWRRFSAGNGRYIVGAPVHGEIGKPVGQALTDGENRPTGKHDHSYLDAPLNGDYQDGVVGKGRFQRRRVTAYRTNESEGAAGVDGTNAPYVQLLLCERL